MKITYKELVDRLDNVFLFNKAPELDLEMLYEGLENGSLWVNEDDEERDEVKEIFQYYLVKPNDAEYIKEHTNELIFYSEVLDEYILGHNSFWHVVGRCRA